ncbi:hypothetical protein K438DRAFT_1661719 [Mycena galopus ATCC 62051]|nr:hypothetical protein K438DRAFT_1661719 [Mycena galopus ATCC 62051]
MASSVCFTFPEVPPPPASVAHFLHSAAPLGNMESSIAISHIEKLESQIAMLDEAIAALELRRADLLQSVKLHKAVLSAVRRMPPEILGEIFSHATFEVQLADIETQSAPWLFTRVCRRWSAVALATPALWSTIFLDINENIGQGAVSLTKLCLERSTNVPLTVSIRAECEVHSPHPILDAVLASSERWRTAELIMEVPLLQMTSIRGRLSALTTLVILMILDSATEPFDDAFLNAFSVAPQLRSLQALCSGGPEWIRAPFSLPWRQLTRVCTAFASSSEAYEAFRNFRNRT